MNRYAIRMTFAIPVMDPRVFNYLSDFREMGWNITEGKFGTCVVETEVGAISPIAAMENVAEQVMWHTHLPVPLITDVEQRPKDMVS